MYIARIVPLIYDQPERPADADNPLKNMICNGMGERRS
jgi:hypothetical protein